MSNTNLLLEEKRERSRHQLLRIRNLPSLPNVILEVSGLLENPKASAKDLSKVISEDQGLVAKVLTIANSPLYGLPRRVSTIEFAVVVLGFDQIKNLVYALTLMEAFKTSNSEHWDKKKFWSHCFVTGMLAKKIADDLNYQKSGEVLTAGLLHDLGISVIQRYFEKEFSQIAELVTEEGFNYSKAEEEVLGMTHEEIGYLLINKWNLPESLGDAIRYHHKPSQAKSNRQLAAILHFADYLTQISGIGNFLWDEEYEVDKGIIDILKLGSEEYLNALITTYSKTMQGQFTEFTQ